MPGVVLYVLSGRALLGVLGIAGGAVGVFQFALAGLVTLPLVELALPVRRRPVILVPVAAGVITVVLAGGGLAVDRFDQAHPQQTHLLYVLDAGTGGATWVSEDGTAHDWVTAHAPEPADGRSPSMMPLPYRTEPRWTGTAEVAPLDAPQVRLLASRRDGGSTVLQLRVTSPRDADVITLHADRPVDAVTIAAGGHSPVTSRPSYPADVDARAWPYELRFYDPPPDGIDVTVRLRGAGRPRLWVSDYTVGLERLPGFTPRPAGLDRSLDHSSDLVVVGRVHRP